MSHRFVIDRRSLRALRAGLLWAPLVATLTLGLLAGAELAAQAPARPPAPAGERRELLNSERIAQRFGSYAITVLESDGRVRVSNLYSEEEGGRICRTFAVVKYPVALDPAIAAEHGEIVGGGSIGAVFAAHGWKVGKTNLRFLELDAPPRVAQLMHVAPGTALAAHAYVLDVSKAGRTIEYALLVEIHHPDYLRLADLSAIYGSADAAGRESSLDALLATAAEKAAR
jgi:hypothetical protein